MHSEEAIKQRLNELSLDEQQFDLDGTEHEQLAKIVLRAQMKGLLFCLWDGRFESFKTVSNTKLEEID